MSNIHKIPSVDQRYDEASIWIARLDRELSSEEEQSLKTWMDDHAANREALLKMAKLWDKMTVLSRLSYLFPELTEESVQRHGYGFAMAASVLVTVLMGFWASVTYLQDETLDTTAAGITLASAIIYETAIGESTSVPLPDGTEVVLNTDTRIEVAYTDRYRMIKLQRGEIHIQVAHDANRPLGVVAMDKVLQAIGTAFSVEITSDQKVELIVTEGKVLVGVHPKLANNAAAGLPAVLGPSAVTLAAGEEVLLGVPAEQIQEISPDDIEVKLSWRKGSLVFRGESLEDAVTEIGRYTTVEFVILDDKARKTKIGGRYRTGDVEGLLATLEANFSIVHRRDGDGKIVLTSE